ncbi:LysR substrate-binding domain-containing protein [Paeniglutamicibacter cryotolerans]|uniref:DNA-binding transcriptional LysR family regulator n=1 Tax=Paeniglutamicibacter cryotolerans TaxID=670079 RepID=A0A839QGP6_9MICC|nr:LysR substrate-binding domain-containing protein [Paeniglutamicibacter cryotolerans]MBB2994783.1 DNA-binding transcriptional LysR family regulator [Paeniglutamicibacter cryotolerans]
MDMRQLRYFVAVAEEKHFGRAAQRLHMAQPPLSQQIKQLEEQLDTLLLVRTTRKVDLTPAGELLLARARLLLAEVEKVEQDVRLVGQGASGILRIGVSGTATYRLMPRIVQAAQIDMPGLRLNVQGEMLTPQMEIALEEERLDVAILRPPVRSGQLSLKFLEQDELVVALPEDHELASRGLLDLADLAGEPFISYPLSSAVNRIALEACRKTGFSPRVVQEAHETSTLLSFVSAGMGVALVPTTRRMFALQGIVFRALRNAPAVDLAVAWKAGNESALLLKFLDLFDSPASLEGTPA